MQTIDIEEIKKLVDELAGLLRQNGQAHTSDALLAIAERFKQPAEVRPAVYSLDQAVRQWLRKTEGSQQGDVSIRLTAQFLADACKNALSQGAIRSLPPTPRESVTRLGRVAGVTLAAGVAVVLIPAVLLVLGVNWVDLLMPAEVAGIAVERGKEKAIVVNLSSPAPTYDGLVDVRIDLAGQCRGSQWEDLTCEPAERLWDDGLRHPTFHIVRPAEVNGILVAVGNVMLRGPHGSGSLLVYADQNTAVGEYVIPLEGAYVAAPEPCVVASSDAGTSDASQGDAQVPDAQVVTPCQAQVAAGESEALPLKRSAISSVIVHVR